LGGLLRPYGVSREKLSAFESTTPTQVLVIVHPISPWADYGTLIILAAPLNRTNLVVLCLPCLDKYQQAPAFLLPTLSITPTGTNPWHSSRVQWTWATS